MDQTYRLAGVYSTSLPWLAGSTGFGEGVGVGVGEGRREVGPGDGRRPGAKVPSISLKRTLSKSEYDTAFFRHLADKTSGVN